jgi:hypothetical protein
VLLAGAARAQVDLTLVDTVPRGARLFSGGSVRVLYTVAGAPQGARVDFFRDDDAGRVSVDVPPLASRPSPLEVVLPLKTGVDRASNEFRGVARDVVSNDIDLAGPLVVVSDDVGPDVPEILEPVFPATVFSGGALTVRGTVRNTAPGGATLPETAGRVEIRRAGDQALLGGGVILADGSFQALVNLLGLVPGGELALEVRAIDEVGNLGQVLAALVRCPAPGTPAVEATLDPPAGTVTSFPAVSIRGTVRGGPVLSVHFFVNGLLESQVRGLTEGQRFLHTLTLPGPGAHALAVQVTADGQAPSASLATPLGAVTRSP